MMKILLFFIISYNFCVEKKSSYDEIDNLFNEIKEEKLQKRIIDKKKKKDKIVAILIKQTKKLIILSILSIIIIKKKFYYQQRSKKIEKVDDSKKKLVESKTLDHFAIKIKEIENSKDKVNVLLSKTSNSSKDKLKIKKTNDSGDRTQSLNDFFPPKKKTKSSKSPSLFQFKSQNYSADDFQKQRELILNKFLLYLQKNLNDDEKFIKKYKIFLENLKQQFKISDNIISLANDYKSYFYYDHNDKNIKSVIFADKNVKGDGHCGFYAAGIKPKELFQRISSNNSENENSLLYIAFIKSIILIEEDELSNYSQEMKKFFQEIKEIMNLTFSFQENESILKIDNNIINNNDELEVTSVIIAYHQILFNYIIIMTDKELNAFKENKIIKILNTNFNTTYNKLIEIISEDNVIKKFILMKNLIKNFNIKNKNLKIIIEKFSNLLDKLIAKKFFINYWKVRLGPKKLMPCREILGPILKNSNQTLTIFRGISNSSYIVMPQQKDDDHLKILIDEVNKKKIIQSVNILHMGLSDAQSNLGASNGHYHRLEPMFIQFVGSAKDLLKDFFSSNNLSNLEDMTNLFELTEDQRKINNNYINYCKDIFTDLYKYNYKNLDKI